MSLEQAQSQQKATAKQLQQVQNDLDTYSLHSSGTSTQIEKLTKEREGLQSRIRDLEHTQASLAATPAVEVKPFVPFATPGRHGLASAGTPSRRNAARPRSSSTSSDLRTTRLEMELDELRNAKVAAEAAAEAAQTKLSKASKDLMAMENAKMAVESTAAKEIERLKDVLEDRMYDIQNLQHQLDQNPAVDEEEVERLRDENEGLTETVHQLQLTTVPRSVSFLPPLSSQATMLIDFSGLRRSRCCEKCSCRS